MIAFMRENSFWRNYEPTLVGGGFFLAIVLVWEAVARFGLVDPALVSAPSRIVKVAAELLPDPEFWRDLSVSAREFAVGYVSAVLVGIPLGLLIGISRRFQYLLGPLVDTLNTVPRITLLPLLVIWFGIGIWSKIAVVLLGAVIPIVISTQAGVHANEKRLVKVAQSFGASSLKIFQSIVLPGAVPFIFTGLKYGAGRALLGVVVGELYAATAGVGHMIVNAGNSFQIDIVFLGVFLFTAAGLVTNAVLNHLERRFEKWRPPVGAAA
ncbi:MAG: ABC transporter permease [Xanthobacteraceae bacterium]